MSWKKGKSRSELLLKVVVVLGALSPVAVLAQQPFAVARPTAVLASVQEPPPPQPPADPSLPPLAPPQVEAPCAVVMDAATGQVVWEKNSHLRRPNASTTKIMVATLVLESGRLDDTITFSDKARQTPYANLNAKPGEKFKLKDVLYAIMLRSSNDSCVAVGEHLAGEAWRFAARMTEKAHEIGAKDTNFVSTNGLYDPNHYSTAYDLALMARYAMQYPLFNEVVGTKDKVISRSINWKDTLLHNHNKFLSKYQGADGVKTGYVKESGRCLVASSTRTDQGSPWRLITVVLKSPDPYGDSERMMDWSRKNFQPIFMARSGEQVGTARIKNGAESTVPLLVAKDLKAVVRRDLGNNAQREIRTLQGVSAPIAQNQVAGQLVGMLNGHEVARVDLVAARSVRQAWTMAGVAPVSGASLLLGFFLFGPRYVRAIAKGARRRRRRVPPGRGGADRSG